MPLAARISDHHSCPKVEPPPHMGGPIVKGSANVLVEDLPAARAKEDYTGDFAICAAGGPDYLAQGCPTVLINDMLACRVDDLTQHGGVIVGHAATVEIGVPGDAKTVLAIDSAAGGAAGLGDGAGGEAGEGDGGDESRRDAAPSKPAVKYILRVMAHGQNLIGPGDFSYAGHIFVAWGTAKDGEEPVVGESVGFGPSKASGSHTGWFNAHDGEIWTGSQNGSAAYKTDFELDAAAWNASKAVRTSFDATSYSVGTHDCGSFVMDVAQAGGLSVGFRPVQQTVLGVYWAIVSRNAAKIYTGGLDDGAVL